MNLLIGVFVGMALAYAGNGMWLPMAISVCMSGVVYWGKIIFDMQDNQLHNDNCSKPSQESCSNDRCNCTVPYDLHLQPRLPIWKIETKFGPQN